MIFEICIFWLNFMGNIDTNSDSICMKKQAYLNIFDTSYVFTTYVLKIVTPQQS